MKHEGAGFDRSKSCWDRSWALRRFKYHHGELNRSYWSDVVARQHTARALAGVPDDVQTAAHLNLLGPDAQRPPRTVGELKVALAETGNWARLNATMALASYFEVYVSTIVTLAIESDPGALIGLRGQVDGTILLKSMPKYSQAQAAIPSVKGTWQERVQYLQRLFGPVPAGLAGLVTELEKLRKFRNGVGHAFGRDLDQYVPVRPGSATIRNRDVIRTANMGLKVKDVSKAMSETETQVAAMGGFVENTNFNQESDASRGTMNFQVPEKNFDAIVEYLGKAGTIVNNNKTGTDVTGEIAYTDGRIVSLADEELNLIKELQRTRNSTDRLEIRRRLSYVRQEIRGLKEQNKATKDLADMSRFVVSFEKSTQFDNASPDDWFGQTTQGAGNVLGFFGRIFGVGLIYTLYLAPIWLPIVGVVWWLRRRAKIGSV